MKYQKRGFTLVELIVVITVLAILSAVGFVSYAGYTKEARDSNRLTALSMIDKGLSVYSASKGGKSIMPDNVIPVTLSGTIVGYQGDAGDRVLNEIRVNSGGKDPLTGNNYSYYLSVNRNKFQVLGYLENEPSAQLTQLTPVHADYNTRTAHFKGFGLGMLLNENDTPIHRVSQVITTGEFDMHSLEFANYTVRPLFSNSVTYRNKALFAGGQLQNLSRKKLGLEKSDCPENFILVPGNYDLGQPDFCIGKYEASNENDKYGTLYTQKNKIPVTGIQVHGTGFSGCRANGKGYHIMTLSEWVTIARNIEMQSDNWTGGTVGMGYIKGGNNGSTINGFNAGSILNTGSNTTQVQDDLRQLTLSNGEVIWDFVGNVWELVQPLNLTNLSHQNNNYRIYDHTSYGEVYSSANIKNIGTTSSVDWNTISDMNFIENYGPITDKQSSLGFGMVRENDTDYYFVGGDYNENHSYENGLYSLLKHTSSVGEKFGTRCAFIPK